MSSLNELESKTTPPQNGLALEQSRNKSDMSVTRLVFQLGMGSRPAAPHRAKLGSAQFGSVEQQLAHEADDVAIQFVYILLTAFLSASPSANGAATAPGMRVQHTTHDAINARDREIRIPRARSSPGRLRRCVPASTRGLLDQA